VRAPHSHSTTVHGDCKITVQFSHGFFPPKSRYSENAQSEIAYNEGCLYLKRKHQSPDTHLEDVWTARTHGAPTRAVSPTMMLSVTILKVCNDLFTIICHIMEPIVRIENPTVRL
jgi:hypothetical protein